MTHVGKEPRLGHAGRVGRALGLGQLPILCAQPCRQRLQRADGGRSLRDCARRIDGVEQCVHLAGNAHDGEPLGGLGAGNRFVELVVLAELVVGLLPAAGARVQVRASLAALPRQYGVADLRCDAERCRVERLGLHGVAGGGADRSEAAEQVGERLVRRALAGFGHPGNEAALCLRELAHRRQDARDRVDDVEPGHRKRVLLRDSQTFPPCCEGRRELVLAEQGHCEVVENRAEPPAVAGVSCDARGLLEVPQRLDGIAGYRVDAAEDVERMRLAVARALRTCCLQALQRIAQRAAELTDLRIRPAQADPRVAGDPRFRSAPDQLQCLVVLDYRGLDMSVQPIEAAEKHQQLGLLGVVTCHWRLQLAQQLESALRVAACSVEVEVAARPRRFDACNDLPQAVARNYFVLRGQLHGAMVLRDRRRARRRPSRKVDRFVHR